MFARLADEDVPWDATEVFQVDERVAPDGDPDRNLTHLEHCLPPAAVERLRPMPVTDEDLDGAAQRYGGALPEQIDLIHLGLGPDGHTASLVPDDQVLEVTDRRVALTAGEYEGHRRMTLTYPTLAAARRILWLVTGEDKRDALTKLLDGDPSIPAGRVEQREGIVVSDREDIT
jgi:6-phosphogluconolactonase